MTIRFLIRTAGRPDQTATTKTEALTTASTTAVEHPDTEVHIFEWCHSLQVRSDPKPKRA